jgi:hypothetical protein
MESGTEMPKSAAALRRDRCGDLAQLDMKI